MRPLPAWASMSATVSLFQNPIKMDSHARRSCPPLPSVSLISGRTCLQISAPARPVHSNHVFLPCPTLVHVAISKSPRFMRRSGLFNVRQEFSFWCRIRTLSPQTYRTIRTHEGIKKRASRPHKSIFIGFSHVVSVLVPCCFLVGFLLFLC